MLEDEDKYFTGAQAAEFLGVKPATLYAYASRGLIESIQAESGRERAYRLADLIKLRQASRGFKNTRDLAPPSWTGPVIKSAITEIKNDGHRYRGHSAIELARLSYPFEQVAELLWGTDADLKNWRQAVPIPLPKYLKKLSADEVDYIDLIKALIASVEILDPVTRKLQSDELYTTARRLIVTMALVPALNESDKGYMADGQFPIAQSLLASLHSNHSHEKSAVVNAALVLCADHELNASALAARIAASCDASLYSTLLSALGTFSGSLHGLASRLTENMISNSMKFKNPSAWLKDYLRHNETLPGFDATLYEHGDPRAKYLLNAARSVSSKDSSLKRLFEIVDCVEDKIGTKPNLDIGLTAITYALSLPPGSGSTIFAVSRTAGWIAHAIEQRSYGGVIRPRAKYIGKTSAVTRALTVICLLMATLLAQAGICSVPPETENKSNLVSRPKRELFTPMPLESLDESTRELAEQLEIMPLLQELYKNKSNTEQRRLMLRQKIQETILESYLDSQSVKAEADREQIRLSLQRETLLARRDRNVELNNAGNFIMSGTLNTIGSILGFPKSANPVSGNLNQMLSGVVSTSMSMYALKQNAGGKTTGQGSPTLLAELFGRPTDFRTSYPESVWRFLHGKSPDTPSKTRLQILEESWIGRHLLEPHGSARETSKLDAVCGKPGLRMSINDLSDQINMIGEVEAVTELMDHHLRDLLRMIDSDLNI